MIMLFQAFQRIVCGVGLYLEKLFATDIVEFEHQQWVALPGFGCGSILETVGAPKSVVVAKSTDTALGTDTGTTKHCNAFH